MADMLLPGRRPEARPRWSPLLQHRILVRHFRRGRPRVIVSRAGGRYYGVERSEQELRRHLIDLAGSVGAWDRIGQGYDRVCALCSVIANYSKFMYLWVSESMSLPC